MKKPWSGRFKEKTAPTVEEFTESISFDCRLWPYDIKGSIAHAKMLAKQKIIKRSEAEQIIKGLKEIADDFNSGKFRFRPELEDIHMNIEKALIQKIGHVGGKLHTARSRNDQVALDLRLYLKNETKAIIQLLSKLEKVFVKIAEKQSRTIMPGYTHLQRAQPVLLGHHLLAYGEMLSRDRERFYDTLKRIDIMPLGACALAGTSLPTDRKYVARILGFQKIAENSMDAVSDRDFAIEFLSSSAITMMHLSRMAEEIILWSSEEFSFIEISDSFTTGSSIMPQKKNPDVAELIRGKTGRAYGNLITLLTVMKALPLTYNRDMQEDKLPAFDTVDTLKGSLSVMAEMYTKIKFNKVRMNESAGGGFSTATDIAEYLVMKGLPFREAHAIVGKLVAYCLDKKLHFENISLDILQKFSPLFDNDVYALIPVKSSVNRKTSRGGTSPKEVARQIKEKRKKTE